MKRSLKRLVGAALVALGAGAADAALFEQPLAPNAYISKNGYDWAWASGVGWDTGIAGIVFDISYQAQFGWRIPTAQELTLAPTAPDFLFPGGNVPFNGTDPLSGSLFNFTDALYTGDGACAAAYFNAGTDPNNLGCNWRDGLGASLNRGWYGTPGAFDFYEQLAIRDAIAPVPLPGAALLLPAALASLIVLRRRPA